MGSLCQAGGGRSSLRWRGTAGGGGFAGLDGLVPLWPRLSLSEQGKALAGVRLPPNSKAAAVPRTRLEKGRKTGDGSWRMEIIGIAGVGAGKGDSRAALKAK